ncbi:MAG: sulfurtransferase [Caldilineaceae bacterium]
MEQVTEVAESEASLALPGLIVETDWVVQQLTHPALRLIDVRAADAYAEGHLPGAVHLELPEITGIREGVPGMLIPAADFAARMSAAGIDQRKTVVLYDDNWGMPAARVLWALARFGFTNTAVLNGGWDSWQEQDLPQSTTSVSPEPTSFPLGSNDDHLAERGWLLNQPERADLVVIDTRTPNEYNQGHLPNALNWDWMNAVPAGGWTLMRPAAELRAELSTLGVTPDKEIVTYCRSGVRAAHTYLVLRALGFERVRNYDGSWLEWSHYLAKGEGASHE